MAVNVVGSLSAEIVPVVMFAASDKFVAVVAVPVTSPVTFPVTSPVRSPTNPPDALTIPLVIPTPVVVVGSPSICR